LKIIVPKFFEDRGLVITPSVIKVIVLRYFDKTLIIHYPALLNTAKNTRDTFAVRVRVKVVYLSSVIVIMSFEAK